MSGDDISQHELQDLRRSPAGMDAEDTHRGDELPPDSVGRRDNADESEIGEDEEDGRLNVVNVEEEDYLARDVEPDSDLDKRVRRKLDWILLPFLALLFLLNSLDKSNIGNAETAGFTHDTGLSAGDINTSMGVFFAFFVALQPVGAALGRKIGMKRWVPGCMSLWGLCTLLHIWVRKRWQLILLRIAIATLEAGFYPTTVSYLSLFYTRYEFAVRLGFFYGQTAVAGVLGGVLSWAVFSRFPQSPGDNTGDGATVFNSGFRPWEALFLIEGSMTLVVALVGFFWLPRSANSAWFFNAAEKDWADRRILLDRDHNRNSKQGTQVKEDETNEAPDESQQLDGPAEADSYDRLLHNADDGADLEADRKSPSPVHTVSITADAGLTRHDILAAFFNYKIWHLLICNILSAIPATAFGVFLPLVIKQLSPSLSLSPAASNLLSAPPFACGALTLFIFTRWSDYSKQRLVPILWGLGLLQLGVALTVLVPMGSYILRYFSLCVLLSGSYIASPLTVAWLTNNTPEPGKRAVLLGINGWGNLAGVFLSVLFTPEDRLTGYTRPLLITLLCVLASFVGFTAFWIMLVRENKWRREIIAKWTAAECEREERYGDAGVAETRWDLLRQKCGLDALARWLGWDEMRSGDQKITFVYGL